MAQTTEIEGPRFARVAFSSGIAGETLMNGIFEDISGNDVTFKNVNFSFSRFVRGYFYRAVFENCQFTGCRFESCNFRGATFSQCDFKYASFDRTVVPPRELVVSAPEWPNVRRELMQVLRANAESLGDIDAVRAFIREEMKARREHLRRARDLQEEYYIKKYSSLGPWIKVRWQSFLLWLDRNLLGYGEHIGRAVIGSVTLLVIVAVAQFSVTIDMDGSLGAALSHLWGSLRYVVFLLLDVPDTATREPYYLAVIVVCLRYFLIGLLVAALFRALSHR